MIPDLLENTQPYRCNPDGIVRVWAYIGDDDPLRGESRGATGLAKRVAEKLNGQMLYVDQDMLDEAFPNTKSMVLQLKQLLARDGTPDIVIGHNSKQLTRYTEADPTFLIDTILTLMAEKLPDNDTLNALVPHHLTATDLKQHGEAFKAHHAHIKRPITAILLAEIDADDNVATIIDDHCLADGAGTLYFCPRWSTSQETYEAIVSELQFILKQRGLSKKFNIFAPSLDCVRNQYNPYIGLLDQSDHVVLIGQSQSMISESIISGHPVHFHLQSIGELIDGWNEDKYKELEKHGYIRYLKNHEPNTQLDSTRLPPIDITGKIADYIAHDFDRAARIRTRRPTMMAMQNPFCLSIAPHKSPF